MKVSYKVYKCLNCGHEQLISTNHYGDCLDFCHGCSWKMSWRGDGRYADKTAPEMGFPMFGHMYRPFTFASEYELKREEPTSSALMIIGE